MIYDDQESSDRIHKLELENSCLRKVLENYTNLQKENDRIHSELETIKSEAASDEKSRNLAMTEERLRQLEIRLNEATEELKLTKLSKEEMTAQIMEAIAREAQLKTELEMVKAMGVGNKSNDLELAAALQRCTGLTQEKDKLTETLNRMRSIIGGDDDLLMSLNDFVTRTKQKQDEIAAQKQAVSDEKAMLDTERSMMTSAIHELGMRIAREYSMPKSMGRDPTLSAYKSISSSPRSVNRTPGGGVSWGNHQRESLQPTKLFV